jgi:hypothetical protein
LLAGFTETLQIRDGRLPLWNSICRNAGAARFSWEIVVKDYEFLLYDLTCHKI